MKKTSGNILFIYGAPGVGKTTYSLKVKEETGLPLIEGDYLREIVAQKEKTESEDPFAYVGTKEAFRKFGKFSEENVLRGLQAVRKSMNPYIIKEIAKFPKGVILEASFIDPHTFKDSQDLILVIASDEQRHRFQFFQHRDESQTNIEGFQAARIIQDYLLQESKSLPVKIIDISN